MGGLYVLPRKASMKVYVQEPNATALKKALKKLRVRAARMKWITVSKEVQTFYCVVKEPKPEEELQLLKYGELR